MSENGPDRREVKRDASFSSMYRKKPEYPKQQDTPDESNFPKIAKSLETLSRTLSQNQEDRKKSTSDTANSSKTNPEAPQNYSEIIQNEDEAITADKILEERETERYEEMAENENEIISEEKPATNVVIDPTKGFEPNYKSSESEIKDALGHLKKNPGLKKIDD